MAYEEDTSKQQSEQEKPVVRRDKVVVTKVTNQKHRQPMRHDPQRLHPCKGTRL